MCDRTDSQQRLFTRSGGAPVSDWVLFASLDRHRLCHRCIGMLFFKEAGHPALMRSCFSSSCSAVVIRSVDLVDRLIEYLR
ncbi:hypothetical protein ACF1BU_34480 [Streptomyces sp. NPDC014724]|uniref:hypothetical protein n=1 Tax=unclassified Streptomyces TaxID=2593676 RepID=UPI0036F91631